MITPGDRITRFVIREPHRSKLLEAQVHWGHGGLSEITFYRTYSRRKPDGTQETWQDCVVRVVEGMFTILRTHAEKNRIPWREERGQRHALEAAQRMLAFKWTPPGRGLWMMGTDYLWERGGAALGHFVFGGLAFEGQHHAFAVHAVDFDLSLEVLFGARAVQLDLHRLTVVHHGLAVGHQHVHDGSV